MKKVLVGIILVLVVLLVGWFFLNHRSVSYAAIRVDSFPKATVTLNGKNVGTTSYSNDKLTPGSYSVILSAPSGANWQTKINLTADTLTYISRDLALTDDQSAGQMLFLESLSSGQPAQLAVVSTPDAAKIAIDGLDKGVTSTLFRDVPAGDHEIIISSPGYSDQVVHGRLIDGYRLNVIVKLAQMAPTAVGTATASAVPIASVSATPAKPYVVIKDTPTGFLRVRSDPSVSASETAQVKPGETYPYLDDQNNWVQIKLPTLSGWVSENYVTIER
ncbi:MAG: PEGA domain-containing protein [Patescibacteria group bacterium]|nr:PEGA domain-containing protein [Patescibacteria group bacterium]MCL5431780.1 PEGA domain-containing protein [Patescibacteria group bacterium]